MAKLVRRVELQLPRDTSTVEARLSPYQRRARKESFLGNRILHLYHG
jgi:hypothetical protein